MARKPAGWPSRRCTKCGQWPAQPRDTMCAYCRIYRYPHKLTDAERAKIPF